MADRYFKLPGIDDLNKDQDAVLRLPEKGQFLIVGGPGTGKSVVALLRVMKYHDNGNYQFLTYNKVLAKATKQLMNIDLNGSTLSSFFWHKHKDIFGNPPPNIAPYKPDYNTIIKQTKELQPPAIEECLIIDEGQDMPPQFYDALVEFGYENFFIVSDQNQQITDQCSSRQDLTDTLGLKVEDVYELKENYRNSNAIAKLAEYFFTDIASPKPNLPPVSRISLSMPTLYRHSDVDRFIELILREADKDPKHLIGVVVAKNAIQELYIEKLTNKQIPLDNEKPSISSYSSKGNKEVEINFAQGGIVVLNDKSIKGLEFDIVFVVIDGFNINNNYLEAMKKRFYVMSSRAIKKLVFLQGGGYSSVEQILPKDPTILKREEL